MNLPASRLLGKIDARIASATNQHMFDCALAERACYSARQGNFDAATDAIAKIRSRYASNPDAEITILLNLAEGLVSYFRELGFAAHDKVLRAHALSAALGFVRLHALTAAWLAQMDFSRLDLPATAKHVAESLNLSARDDHSARSRASLIVAQALHLAGRWDLASPWYTRARIHANSDGDELTVSALMHNMVSMRLDHFRQVVLTETGDKTAAAYALVGIDSSENFDHLIGTSTLEELRPIMRARFFSLNGHVVRALEIYETHIADGLTTSLARLQSDVLSDLAWCRMQRGQSARAREDALSAEKGLSINTQLDDRAATHSRLASVYLQLGETDEAIRHQTLATSSWNDFALLQGKTVDLFVDLAETGKSALIATNQAGSQP